MVIRQTLKKGKTHKLYAENIKLHLNKTKIEQGVVQQVEWKYRLKNKLLELILTSDVELEDINKLIICMTPYMDTKNEEIQDIRMMKSDQIDNIEIKQLEIYMKDQIINIAKYRNIGLMVQFQYMDHMDRNYKTIDIDESDISFIEYQILECIDTFYDVSCEKDINIINRAEAIYNLKNYLSTYEP